MWQMFNESARKAIFYAQDEAIRLGQNDVSTEHFLLGLIRVECIATQVLGQLGIKLAQIRSEVERQAAKGGGQMGHNIQLTPQAKRVIDLSHEEAKQLGDTHVGTEHLLLGLIREGEGLGGRVLLSLGADLDRVRQEVSALQIIKKSLTSGAKTENEHALQTIDLALLQPALSKNATEIKVDPKDGKVTISHLIEGRWQEFLSMPLNTHKTMLDCCKLAAGLDLASQETQQGQVSVRYGDKERTFVVTCEPTEHGEKITFTGMLEIKNAIV